MNAWPPLSRLIGSTNAQKGATLIVAIIMLLLLTLLALSSMRGVSLESRITGNLKLQKNLTAAAEAGLRMGESSIGFWKCQGTDTGSSAGTGAQNDMPKPCINYLKLTPNANGDYAAQFTAANLIYVNSVNTGYGDVKIQWYIVSMSNIGNQTVNGCALNQNGCIRSYYEITSCASTVLCSSDTTTQRVIMRSVFSVAVPKT
ncbi:PilX N-terminal domain-containing pilus assembly protein [Pseudomonas sp. NPDC090202]|uniref:PilX N-terminal domain-containing pilus assembly protein n=1 Tax=unclassified Pseudomonas TaxID=196821 RepID=UPI003824E22D